MSLNLSRNSLPKIKVSSKAIRRSISDTPGELILPDQTIVCGIKWLGNALTFFLKFHIGLNKTHFQKEPFELPAFENGLLF